jgi:PIN domain nuclease of toxin-antitoxin system
VTALLDTHFLVWILLKDPRLAEYPWLERYRPWRVSPITLLELEYLGEVGRLEVDSHELQRLLDTDPRIEFDDLAVSLLVAHAVRQRWTRDPFDRLLAAHSSARRIPICSVDRTIRANHGFLVEELALERP